ncbi:MAG TPA: glycosyltransferase N-terminal domain-containing protein [Smithellaceae bacterium]|nr:glycosyltransferase N-terminal domain-containing protein [Smithellaceae bacterium]
MLILYNILLLLASVIGIPYYLLKMALTGKYRKSLIPKLGGRQETILADLPAGRPRIWIHAVSVGEVTAAKPIVAALKARRPDIQVIFSTSTETGQGMARQLLAGVDAFIYFPLDIPFVVRKVIRQAHPDIFVMVETELWPNFLQVCHTRGIKALMVNGRISPRSYLKYKATKFFWRIILRYLDAAAMISEIDAARLREIGLATEKVRIYGNAKYDALAAMASPELHEEMRQRLNIRAGENFLVAGSTHEGEETVIVAVYLEILKRHPDFKLIMVPRHIERAPAVLSLLQQAGLPDIVCMSEINKGRKREKERVILTDVIGDLFKIYSLATIVYCGGSLVPRGGQNILEAAAWGKVIFYGPSMEDFSEEKELLEQAGAGITIRNAAELQAGIFKLLESPQDLAARGARGQAVVEANKGAAARYADFIIGRL